MPGSHDTFHDPPRFVALAAGTRVSGKEILDQPSACHIMTRRNISLPSAKMARMKSWTCRGRILQTAYASKFTQQSTTGVDIILDARGIRRCCNSFTGWSDPLVVIGFEAGGTPVVKANYLLLKNIGAQRTAGERLQDRSARAGKEIFLRRSFHSMSRVGSNQRRRSPVRWRSSGDAFP